MVSDGKSSLAGLNYPRRCRSHCERAFELWLVAVLARCAQTGNAQRPFVRLPGSRRNIAEKAITMSEYVPAGHCSICPFFIVANAQGLIAFFEQAFDGTTLSRIEREDGTVMHATVRVGSSLIMVGTRHQEYQNSTHIYVSDVDAVYRRCLELGAATISEPATFSYGDRSAGIRDPYGNLWWIGTYLGQMGEASERAYPRSAPPAKTTPSIV